MCLLGVNCIQIGNVLRFVDIVAGLSPHTANHAGKQLARSDVGTRVQDCTRSLIPGQMIDFAGQNHDGESSIRTWWLQMVVVIFYVADYKKLYRR